MNNDSKFDLLNTKIFDSKRINEYKLLQFNIVNTSSNDYSFNLFDPYIEQIIPTQSNTPNTLTTGITYADRLDWSVYDSTSNVMWLLFRNTTLNFSYVANADVTTGALLGTTISLPFVGLIPTQIYYAPESNKLLVSRGSNQSGLNARIYCIDLATNLGNMYSFPAPSNAGTDVLSLFCYNTASKTFFIFDLGVGHRTLHEFNAATETFVSAYNFSASPVGATGANVIPIYCPANNSIYVYNNFDFFVYKFSCSPVAYVSAIAIPSNVSGVSTLNLGNGLIYLNAVGLGNIYTVSTITDTFTSTIVPDGNPDTYNWFFFYPTTSSIYFYNVTTDTIGILNTSNAFLGYSPLIPAPVGASDNSPTYIPTNNFLWFGFSNPTNGFYYIDGSAFSSPIYIAGTDVYNQDIADWRQRPVIIPKMLMLSTDAQNSNQVINYQYNDAYGNVLNNAIIPQNTISVNQLQSNMTQVDFGDTPAVFGLYQSFSNFSIKANSTINLTIYYKQVDRKNISQQKAGYACRTINESINNAKIGLIKKKYSVALCKTERSFDCLNEGTPNVKPKDIAKVGIKNYMPIGVKPFSIADFNREISK